MGQFGQMLRSWRETRRFSQLDLACEASVSSRHISFLETGRSRPSRDMVLHLCEALTIPRAARNGLLGAAGFAPVYSAEQPDAAALRPVLAATARMLERHDPYPAVVLDGVWCLKELNNAARRLFSMAGLEQGDNLIEAMSDPNWGPSVVENWGEVGHHTMLRLRAESMHAGGVEILDKAAANLAADPIVAAWRPDGPLPPVIPTVYRTNDLRLSMFSTIAQFRSAEDVAVADMHIELMFPVDEETRLILEKLGE